MTGYPNWDVMTDWTRDESEATDRIRQIRHDVEIFLRALRKVAGESQALHKVEGESQLLYTARSGQGCKTREYRQVTVDLTSTPPKNNHYHKWLSSTGAIAMPTTSPQATFSWHYSGCLVYPTPAVSHLQNSPRLNMQFSNLIKLATFLAASGFAVGAPAPGEIMHEARTVTLGSFCTGPGSSGCIPFTRPSLPSGCVNNSPGFINNISFYTINAGFKCTWFK
ncbi:hypothetical protein C8J57DRAFT_1241925 [Mycena rebaudengoi]|nr:hypothetical protein C8J57DRAFT_1241925 [Mycena rebaudengoi]